MNLHTLFTSRHIDAANREIETRGSVRSAFSAVVAEEDDIRSALRAEEREDEPNPEVLRALRTDLRASRMKLAVLTAME